MDSLLIALEKLNFTIKNPMKIKSYLYKNRDLFARLLLICQKTKELFSDIKEFYSKVTFKVSLRAFDTLEILTTCSLT